MDIGSKPCSSMISLNDPASAAASGHLPRRTLLAISQAVTALTQATVSSAATTRRARSENRWSPARNQTKAWLSKRTLIAAIPQFQLIFRQRVKKEPIRNIKLPLQRPELGTTLRIDDRLQPHHRVLSTRDNNLFTRLGARDELGQRCFRFVDCYKSHEAAHDVS